MSTASSLTFLRAMTHTSASVTAANAASKRKYDPVDRPVLK